MTEQIALQQTPSSKRLQLLEQSLTVLERELEWRKANERLQFFEPNGKQEEFINLVGSSDSLVSVFSASNSLGKTTLLVNVLGNLVFGPQNRFFDQGIFKNWTGVKRARFITNPKLVEEIAPFHTEIQKWWPKGKYEAIKAGKNYYSQYKANGWVIDVMSYDQDPSQFEGATIGIALFDEPPPEELWTPTIRGLRGRGRGYVFMTPLTHAAWFYDKVVPAHPNDIVYGSMEDGCKQHGVRGHLDHSEIEKQIAELMVTRPDEVDARVYGKAMYLQGLIFKTFYPNVHVLKDDIQAPKNANVWNVVDPHSDKPFASIWAFPDERGDVYIFDEWPNEDFYKMHNCQLTIQDYKRIFGDKEQGLSVYKRIIDRHFADTASAFNKRTLRQELQAIGLLYHPSYKAEEEIDTGIEKVRRYLAYDTSKPLSALNQPKLFISPKCKNVINSLSKWSRNPENGKVQESYKDFCDVVRYLLVDEPKVSAPLPPQEFKKRW